MRCRVSSFVERRGLEVWCSKLCESSSLSPDTAQILSLPWAFTHQLACAAFLLRCSIGLGLGECRPQIVAADSARESQMRAYLACKALHLPHTE